MDIRNALLNKLHQSNLEDLKSIIEEGIASKEETILPGLGVLFEEYYKDLNDNNKFNFLQHLVKLLG